MGDALGHSIVPGVAGAYILGLPFALGPSSPGCWPPGMAFVAKRRGSRGCDHRPRVHLVLRARRCCSPHPRSVNVKSSCSATSSAFPSGHQPGRHHQPRDAGGAGLKWKDLMVVFFDPNHARSLGLPTRLLHVTLHAACGGGRRRAANRGGLPRHRHGGDAGRHGLPADGPVRACCWLAAHGRGDELRRRLCQLLPRRGDRRVHRDAADAGVPRRICFRAQARHARRRRRRVWIRRHPLPPP